MRRMNKLKKSPSTAQIVQVSVSLFPMRHFALSDVVNPCLVACSSLVQPAVGSYPPATDRSTAGESYHRLQLWPPAHADRWRRLDYFTLRETTVVFEFRSTNAV